MIFSGFGEWVLLIARVVIGIAMIYYGLPKLLNLKKNSGDFDKMGFRPGIFWGTIAAVLGSLGGVLVILGIFGEIVLALFGIQIFIGLIWKIFWTDKGFRDYSYNILLLVIILILLSFGLGKFVLV